MAFSKLKNKITEMAGNETLGSASVEEIEEVERKAPKRKKKESKPAMSPKAQDKGAGDFGDVLSILDISPHSKVDVMFESGDLDYIQFTQTTPLGFDFDEVADFISKAKLVISTYEEALRKRDKDVQALAAEVAKVEQKMIAQRQEEQLNLMMGEVSEEERLLQENIELKIEIEEYQRKVKALSSGNRNTDKLNREIEALRAENEVLRRTQAQYIEIEDRTVDKPLPSFPKVEDSNKPVGMPALDNAEGVSQSLLDEFMSTEDNEPDLSDDPIDEMLLNIKEEFK